VTVTETAIRSRVRPTKTGSALIAALLLLSGSETFRLDAYAQPSAQKPHKAQVILDRWIKRPKLKGLKLGVSLAHLQSPHIRAENDAKTLYNPASGTKLLTTAAAMLAWKAEKRFATRIHGAVDNEGLINDGLWIVGGADPQLGSKDLDALASTLRTRGVQRIKGPLRIHASIFDGENLPPAYGQKDTTSSYRASTGAFGVDFAGVTLKIVSPRRGAHPTITLSSALGYAVVDNQAILTDGRESKLTYKLTSLPSGKMKITIDGKVGRKHPTFTHRVRMLDPNLGAGHLFQHLLRQRGIVVRGPVVITRAHVPASLPVLGEHFSPRLHDILKDMNTFSNNFMAETVFKHLGMGKQPADWKSAQEAVSKSMTDLGLKKDSFRIVNGSGLYRATTISPRGMVTLLTEVSKRDTLATAFRSTLAVSGRPGTLEKRLRGWLRGRIMGKTGTLNEVVSLSGYLRTKTLGMLAFAIFINDATPARTATLRREIDRLIASWARL
jgi:serine-type D-Ala-D-Ala carboxypeptidase/endopeptidase (penicillin-binding protein 4)